jgi:signal transduction histidine kinase
MLNRELHVGINSTADIAHARLKARALAVEMGFDGTDLTLITTAVTKVASAIVNHARKGVVIFSPILHDGHRSLKIVARDETIGTAGVVKTMQFGYSVNQHHRDGQTSGGTEWLLDENDLRDITELHRQEEVLRNLASKIIHAQEEERRRISRELHDEVGQSLTAISMALASLRNSRVTKPETFSRTIAGTQRVLEETMEKVHQFARELRPAMLDELGLLPALRSHLKNFAACTGLRLKFSADAAAEKLDDEKKTALFRIAQESLNNVAKHAGASRVKISVGQTCDGIRMEIADNGKSFRASNGKGDGQKQHLGLLGMQERVRLVNGHFDIHPKPGRGTTVCVQIPFQSAAAASNLRNEQKGAAYGKNPSTAGGRPHGRAARAARPTGIGTGHHGDSRGRNGPPSH